MNFKDQAALVTGGGSGLGEATARRLARGGARVAILDINLEAAEVVAKEIGGLALRCDVTDAQSTEHALARARKAHGVARIAVNCAGGGAPKRTVGKDGPMPLENFTRVVSLNLFGAFNVTRLAAADMMQAPPLATGERGLVLFTASAAAYEGQVGQAAYSAAKGGLVSLTLQLAREFAAQGVRVMTIAPGIFLTPLMRTLPQQTQDALSAGIPFPSRPGDPDEFAQLVEHIVCNPYLNGEVIRLDGAVRLAPR